MAFNLIAEKKGHVDIDSLQKDIKDLNIIKIDFIPIVEEDQTIISVGILMLAPYDEYLMEEFNLVYYLFCKRYNFVVFELYNGTEINDESLSFLQDLITK